MRTNLLRAGSVVALAAAAALAVAGTSATADPGFSAQAEGAVVQANVAGLAAASGVVAPSSTAGPHYSSMLRATVAGGAVNADVIDSAARQDPNGGVAASGTVVAASLPLLAPITGNVPTAAVISAQCVAASSGVTGNATLTHLNLGKLAIAHLGMPNALVTVPGVATVITDEQILAPDGTLTVNALDIHLLGGILGAGDIVLGSATCGSGTAPSTIPGCACTTPTTPVTTAPRTTEPGGGPNGVPATTTTIPGGGPNDQPSSTTDTAGARPTSTEIPANPNDTPGSTQPGSPLGSGSAVPAGSGSQVQVVPVGAPETGDGSLAARTRVGGR